MVAGHGTGWRVGCKAATGSGWRITVGGSGVRMGVIGGRALRVWVGVWFVAMEVVGSAVSVTVGNDGAKGATAATGAGTVARVGGSGGGAGPSPVRWVERFGEGGARRCLMREEWVGVWWAVGWARAAVAEAGSASSSRGRAVTDTVSGSVGHTRTSLESTDDARRGPGEAAGPGTVFDTVGVTDAVAWCRSDSLRTSSLCGSATAEDTGRGANDGRVVYVGVTKGASGVVGLTSVVTGSGAGCTTVRGVAGGSVCA